MLSRTGPFEFHYRRLSKIRELIDEALSYEPVKNYSLRRTRGQAESAEGHLEGITDKAPSKLVRFGGLSPCEKSIRGDMVYNGTEIRLPVESSFDQSVSSIFFHSRSSYSP